MGLQVIQRGWYKERNPDTGKEVTVSYGWDPVTEQTGLRFHYSSGESGEIQPNSPLSIDNIQTIARILLSPGYYEQAFPYAASKSILMR